MVQDSSHTTARGWWITAGIVVGAWIGWKLTDCEYCTSIPLPGLLIGGLLGGWLMTLMTR
jgi:hypothetical protein